MANSAYFSRRFYLTERLSQVFSRVISGIKDDFSTKPTLKDGADKAQQPKTLKSPSQLDIKAAGLNALKASLSNNKTNGSLSLSASADSVDISWVSQLKSAAEELKKQGENAALNIQISAKVSHKELSLTEFSSTGGLKLPNDLDLIFRVMSKDEDEYKNLKAQFENLFTKTPAELSSDNQSASASTASYKALSASFEATISFSAQESYESLVELSQSGKPMSLAQLKSLKSYTELFLSFEVQKNSKDLSLKDIKMSDPIVLDLSGEGFKLSGANGKAQFDINADGKTDKTGWVSGNTAILCYDKNGNGIIDNGTEFFGEQNGAAHGFEELAKYDADNNKKIDISDPIYKKLRLYRDINGDGKISGSELYSLSSLKIKSIGLEYYKTNEHINGNAIALKGSFERENGAKGQVADVLFAYA